MAGLKHSCECGHATFGEHVRAKNIRVGYCRSTFNLDATREKRWDKNLADYADARRQGVQPDSTRSWDVERAMRVSDKAGEAYGS